MQTWQRPTLPRLKTKYHGRRGVSRPCSERERVQPPRHNHQVGKAQLFDLRSWQALACFLWNTSFDLSRGTVGAQLRKRKARRQSFGGPSAAPLARQDKGRASSNFCSMSTVNENDQADRAISTGKLHALPHFHTRPINVVVFHGSDREHSFSGGFPA